MGVYRIKETVPPPQETQEVEVIDPLPAQFEDVAPANTIPPELRERAARMVLIEGRTARDVGKELGISKNVMTSIVREHFQEFFDVRNMSLAGQLDEAAELMLKRIRDNIDVIPISQLTVAFGILIDKRRDLLNKIAPSPGAISLRIAWADGSGAVELTAGAAATGPAATNPAATSHISHDPAQPPILRIRTGRNRGGLEVDNDYDGPGEVIDIEASPAPDPATSPPPDATDNEDDLW